MSKRAERTTAKAAAYQAAADHLANFALSNDDMLRQEAMKLSERMRSQAERARSRAELQWREAGQ